MDEQLMKVMLEVDEHHWWYRGRRRIIRAELDRLALAPGAVVLDAGCGSGRTMEELVDYGEVHGIELDPEAAKMARGRGRGEVQIGRLEELPWPAATFDLITCLDVIEHTPDDRHPPIAAALPSRAVPLTATPRLHPSTSRSRDLNSYCQVSGSSP
jgi:2-polyprenyl-3-methyl-5-hydroxy-6-metoxy-1,4-benzoquinol methylase